MSYLFLFEFSIEILFPHLISQEIKLQQRLEKISWEPLQNYKISLKSLIDFFSSEWRDFKNSIQTDLCTQLSIIINIFFSSFLFLFHSVHPSQKIIFNGQRHIKCIIMMQYGELQFSKIIFILILLLNCYLLFASVTMLFACLV